MEKAEAPREPEAGAPALDRPVAESEKTKNPRRGRPPKSDKAERTGLEAEKEPKKSGPRKGCPSKADKVPPARSSRPNETNCPEVARKLPIFLFPRRLERISL